MNELRLKEIIEEYLDEIEVMNDAWAINPQAKSETAKKQFLTEFVSKAKLIGLRNTVDFLLPCIVKAFESDHYVHPDIYDSHVHLLFSNLGELIKFLSKKKKSKKVD